MKLKKFAFIFFVILILIISIYYIGIKYYEKPQLIQIKNYYDENKDIINLNLLEQSVIGDVEGVAYIDFEINLINEDTVPLNFKILGATPTAFSTSITNKIDILEFISVEKGETYAFVTDEIDVRPFESDTPTDFLIMVKAENTSYRHSVTKFANVSILVEPNPPSIFTVIINSYSGDTLITTGCNDASECEDKIGKIKSCIYHVCTYTDDTGEILPRCLAGDIDHDGDVDWDDLQLFSNGMAGVGDYCWSDYISVKRNMGSSGPFPCKC